MMRRRHVVSIVVAALTLGAVVASRVGDDPTSPPPTKPTAEPTRPCVFFPMVENSDTTAPDGTYIATVANLDPAARTVSLYIDNGGAGFSFDHVPATPEVAAMPRFTNGSSPAVTVQGGMVVAVDLDRVRWDSDSVRKQDPCVLPPAWPVPACRPNPAAGPLAWPGGFDGDLGTDSGDLPERIASLLTAWGIPTDAAAVELDTMWCAASVRTDHTLWISLRLTSDGQYVLAAVVDDVDGGNTTVTATGAGSQVVVKASGNTSRTWAGHTVHIEALCGGRTFVADGRWESNGTVLPGAGADDACVSRVDVMEPGGARAYLSIAPLRIDPS